MRDKLPAETDDSLKTVIESKSPGGGKQPENRDKPDVLATSGDSDEIRSDGSASAFERTESISAIDQDEELKRKAEVLKNDPSGRSDY